MSNYTFVLSDICKLNVSDSLRDNSIRKRNDQFVRVFYVIDKLTIYVKHSYKASKHVEIYKVINNFPAVDPGIRYERCKTKNITVCVKDVL